METYRILKKVVRATGLNRVILVFIAFFLISALVIKLTEPSINNYGDACWYCFSVISTCGFGDVVVTTAPARIMSALLSIYAVVIIAMLVGVVVNIHSKLIKLRMKETLPEVMDKVEHLTDLTDEELEEVAQHVQKIVLARGERAESK